MNPPKQINMMPKVCLCAIFRNESANVVRCLDATLPVIDYLSICDTGSTDDTLTLIEHWGRERGIPTTVHQAPFVNFGHNRSLSCTLAQQAYPDADYLLLVDADMILTVEQGWDKGQLVDDAYYLKQASPNLEYWNLRLLRTGLPWQCVGVTHEYWACDTPYSSSRLDTLWFDDRGDGGYKAHKFSRDRDLLTAALHDPRTDPALSSRYTFYLAQTYRDMREFKKALTWYRRRVSQGGWPEEVYIAQTEVARLTRLTGAGHDAVVREHIKAFEMRPTRAEALCNLAAYCREMAKYAEGYIYAKVGVSIPRPDDMLFVQSEVYAWRLLDELSVCAYYLGHYQESYDAAQRALAQLAADSPERARIETNLGFTLEKLGTPPVVPPA